MYPRSPKPTGHWSRLVRAWKTSRLAGGTVQERAFRSLGVVMALFLWVAVMCPAITVGFGSSSTKCRPVQQHQPRGAATRSTSPRDRLQAHRLQRVTTGEAVVNSGVDVSPSQEAEHWGRPGLHLWVHHLHPLVDLRVKQCPHLRLVSGQLRPQFAGQGALGPDGEVGTDNTDLDPGSSNLLQQAEPGHSTSSSASRITFSATKEVRRSALIVGSGLALVPEGSGDTSWEREPRPRNDRAADDGRSLDVVRTAVTQHREPSGYLGCAAFHSRARR